MKTLRLWIEATRPKTLFASINPVLLGGCLAAYQKSFSLPLFLITLIAACSIQVGTNFVNDYYDLLKGADTLDRKGPRRVLASGLISKAAMKKAIWIAFAAALLFSTYLIAQGGLIFALIFAVSCLSGILYTAGPFPLAYIGLGDVFVLLFFGPVATLGTFYLQTHLFCWHVFLLGLMPGLFSVAILAVNNIRDQEGDAKVHKKTVVVRWGKRFGQIEYTLAIFLGSLIPALLGYYLPILTLFFALIPLKKVYFFEDPADLNQTLEQTAKLGLIATIFMGINLLIYA